YKTYQVHREGAKVAQVRRLDKRANACQYCNQRSQLEDKFMEAIRRVHDKLYNNGQWVKPRGAGMIDVINSTTEEVMGSVPEGSPEDVDAAVAAARAAFEKWSSTKTEERARRLQLISDRLNMRKDEIAAVVASEVGMPLPLATAVQAGMPAAVMGSYAKLLSEFKFEERIGNAVVVKESVGGVGCITPCNLPLHQ